MASLARGIVLALVGLLLAACGEQAEIVDLGLVGEGEEPPNTESVQIAPHVAAPRQVVVPEAVKGRYQTATLAIKLPGMEKAAEIELPLDGQSHPTDFGTLTVRDYLPAFLMQDDAITSGGAEETNPALWAQWQQEGETIFSGWLFRNYPDMSQVKRPQHQIALVGAR